MSGNQASSVVKKIKPYPFACLLEGNGQTFRFELVHLTPVGFLARLSQEMLHVGEYYQSEFDIPVSRFEVKTRVRVIKTHDRASPTPGQSPERFAEFHFDDLTPPQRKAILTFLNAIGQK